MTRSLAILMLACLAGCAAPPRQPPPAPVPAAVPAPAPVSRPPATPEPLTFPKELASSTPAEIEARQVVDLVAYASRVVAMGADEQRRELAAASQEFSKDNGQRPR